MGKKGADALDAANNRAAKDALLKEYIGMCESFSEAEKCEVLVSLHNHFSDMREKAAAILQGGTFINSVSDEGKKAKLAAQLFGGLKDLKTSSEEIFGPSIEEEAREAAVRQCLRAFSDLSDPHFNSIPKHLVNMDIIGPDGRSSSNFVNLLFDSIASIDTKGNPQDFKDFTNLLMRAPGLPTLTDTAWLGARLTTHLEGMWDFGHRGGSDSVEASGYSQQEYQERQRDTREALQTFRRLIDLWPMGALQKKQFVFTLLPTAKYLAVDNGFAEEVQATLDLVKDVTADIGVPEELELQDLEGLTEEDKRQLENESKESCAAAFSVLGKALNEAESSLPPDTVTRLKTQLEEQKARILGGRVIA